ncbi:MAG: SRPBCC family protein [Caldilineaceae bacterium]
MQPIRFVCRATIAKSAPAICAEIADVTRWREFPGYGPLPGIASAAYERRTADMVGSRIRVHNTDGSTHVEEIYGWESGMKVAMRLGEFSPPLCRLASHFTEEWQFVEDNDATLVTRKFALFPKHSVTRPLLWLIGQFFQRAIARHLANMAQEAKHGNAAA